jgi:hypothetical protein
MPADPGAASRHLELELRVPSDPVPIGEDVTVTVALVNRDSVPVLVNRRLLPAASSVVGEIHMEVTGPPGYVNRKVAQVNAGRPGLDDFAELAPGEAAERTFPLTRFHSLQIPGEYAVRATYSNRTVPDGLAGEPWTGELTSERATLRRV